MKRARRLKQEGGFDQDPIYLWLNPYMGPIVLLAAALTALLVYGREWLAGILPERWVAVGVVVAVAVLALVGGLLVARIVRNRSAEWPEPPPRHDPR